MVASGSTRRRTSPPRVLALLLLLLALIGLAAALPKAGEPDEADEQAVEGASSDPEVVVPEGALSGTTPSGTTLSGVSEAPPSPPRSTVCDATHCDGCLAPLECHAVSECIWHPHEDYCHVREIMLFGHKIDLVKLHDQKEERAEP